MFTIKSYGEKGVWGVCHFVFPGGFSYFEPHHAVVVVGAAFAWAVRRVILRWAPHLPSFLERLCMRHA